MTAIEQTDILIVGAGIAGLSAALEASKHSQVILLTKGRIGETATEKAQGGIAAAIDQFHDSPQLHYEDTIAAGAGLCDEPAVRLLVDEGVERVKELIALGANFDRAETEAGGFALALEGAHKRRRILHAGDTTGEEIQKTLGRKIIKDNLVTIYQHTLGLDLIIANGRCVGLKTLEARTNKIKNYLAKAIILATGGFGQAYLYTTNPESATGDGVAMAYRAGAKVRDMEFIQFHPTSLVHKEEFKDIIALPRFLISEAVRGEGAKLLNSRGERFIGELSARDVVTRAIFEEMQKTKSDHVFLSLADIGPDKIKKRFPVIYQTCLERGLDITKDLIPVAPAAHYCMGGVSTDVDGQTSLPGLFAAGECASLGVHGANRLASNSLLDGLVFGHRAAMAAKSQVTSCKIQSTLNDQLSINQFTHLSSTAIQRLKLILKSQLWKNVGIIRNQAGLEQALSMIKEVQKKLDFEPAAKEEIELRNLALVARLITEAALARKASIGAHYREN